jgi:hypothetical protein
VYRVERVTRDFCRIFSIVRPRVPVLMARSPFVENFLAFRPSYKYPDGRDIGREVVYERFEETSFAASRAKAWRTMSSLLNVTDFCGS